MKLIVKIFLSLLILSILLLASPLFLFLWIKLYISYERNHTENIDTTFFTDSMKKDLLEIVKIFQETNVRYIKIVDNEIYYYDLKQNSISENSFKWMNIKEILNKYNINTTYYFINSDWKIDNIYFNIKSTYLSLWYKIDKPNYSEWYVIPVLVWRVEKVIDDNWYILKDCDRIICQEPQR